MIWLMCIIMDSKPRVKEGYPMKRSNSSDTFGVCVDHFIAMHRGGLHCGPDGFAFYSVMCWKRKVRHFISGKTFLRFSL